MLHGRDQELTRIRELLERARNGRSGALVIIGEPGIGKTALLDAAQEEALGSMQVLRTRGFESERDLPYAGLHALLSPMLDVRERIPPVQSRALGTALAVDPPAPHDPFAVPAAVLSMLSAIVENAPRRKPRRTRSPSRSAAAYGSCAAGSSCATAASTSGGPCSSRRPSTARRPIRSPPPHSCSRSGSPICSAATRRGGSTPPRARRSSRWRAATTTWRASAGWPARWRSSRSAPRSTPSRSSWTRCRCCSKAIRCRPRRSS